MTYTPLDDPLINKKIELDLLTVCEGVLGAVTPVSVILFGGYGRGEGSATVRDNQAVILKDYDILLVINQRIAPSTIYEISEVIHRRLGLSNPLDSVSMDLYSGVHLMQFTRNDLMYFRDVKAYEIKVASKLLWGEDIREQMPLSRADLSPWSGIRFLFGKATGMLETFSLDFLSRKPDRDAGERMIYECCKAYLDMGTLLTLMSGTYEPSYSGRTRVLVRSFAGLFPALSKEMPHFPQRLQHFTDLKLSPTSDKYDATEPVGLWFETRRDLGTILTHYMSQYLRRSFDDWPELFQEYNRRMKTDAVQEMAGYYVEKRLGITNRILVNVLARIASFAYQKQFSARYALRLYRNGKVVLPRVLLESPISTISVSGFLLLFSLRRDGTLDKGLFDAFVGCLRRVYPVEISGSTDVEKWREGRLSFVTAHRWFFDTFYGTG